ncbi:MAG TPA: HAMP domain-containing sensor histidine kinase, partial [Kofleriaceae bacterium]
MLGHEMRNPLAPISTALQLMELSTERAFAMERTVIKRQVDHLTRLVDDLLDISRITSGKIEIKRKHATVASLVADALEIVSPMLEKRHHQLTISVPDDLVVDVDAFRMSQVISNLLSNAAKYTEQSGHIRIEAGREGDEVWISVRDDGVGIAPDMLRHVFDLFTQEPQANDRAHGGLGLGLSIVRSLVVMHGGNVTAESSGRG